MPPLGTHKFTPIHPSGATGDDAEYHRTFEPFSANKLGMWPEFKQKKYGWNYRGEGFHRDYIEEYAKRVGAFYVHQPVGNRLRKVRVVWKDDQKFHTHATSWESIHSTLFPAARLAEPVVDDKLRIMGHLGWWWQDQVFLPKGGRGPDKDVQSFVASGDEIFASLYNPLPSHYRPNELGAPKWKFLLMTAPDGQVVGQFGYDTGAGAVSTIAPWELISIGRAAVTLVGVGSRQVIRLVVRKGSERVAAVGPTKAAAEAAAKRAAAVPPAQIATQSGTIHSVHVGTFGTPGHLIARIEVEQGRVVYRVASIHLKAEGKAIEVKARAAHRDMIQRAAQEAQKRGQKGFTLRGIDANSNFQAHANKLADEIGVAGSGKTLPGSAGGYNSYEVTLDTAKALASKQAGANTASRAARGATGGQSAGRTAGR